MLASRRPFRVEVYKLTDPAVFQNWKSPEPAAYRGMRGVTLPVFHTPELSRRDHVHCNQSKVI